MEVAAVMMVVVVLNHDGVHGGDSGGRESGDDGGGVSGDCGASGDGGGRWRWW